MLRGERSEGYNSSMKNGRERVHEYTAFFEANENGGYTVTVPALPGLVTEGKNLEHARDMARWTPSVATSKA